jgi:nitroreductase
MGRGPCLVSGDPRDEPGPVNLAVVLPSQQLAMPEGRVGHHLRGAPIAGRPAVYAIPNWWRDFPDPDDAAVTIGCSAGGGARGHCMETQVASAMSVAEAIHRRRAVRSYTPAIVDRSTILALLEAAVLAPTAMHEEPWTFAVIQDAAMLRRLSDHAKVLWKREATAHEQALDPVARERQRHLGDLLSDPGFNIFYDAGTLVVICARPASHFVEADCWLAAENLMLLATSLGLGTCPIGFAIPVLNAPGLKEELGIPPDQKAVAPIIVGFPRGVAKSVDRKPPEVLYWR